MKHFLVLLATLMAGAGVQAARPIDVGNRKQLFLDRRFIADWQGIELRVNPPVKRGIVLRGERRWEEGGIGAAMCERTSLVDDGTGQYKLYYTAFALGRRDAPGQASKCLAVSRDGVRWTRPSLGLVERAGSKDNNVLSCEPQCVFVDPKAEPDQRYKGLLVKWGKPPGGIFVVCSPDGVRWTEHPTCLLPFAPDTQNQVFFDTRLGKYVAYLRAWAPMRKVAYVEIDKLLEPWPYDKSVEPCYMWGRDKLPVPSHEFPIAISYDKSDPPGTDVYTPCVAQYPWADEAYFAFPSLMRAMPPLPGSRGAEGLLEIQLAVSRDGRRFDRPDRRPYIPLGPRGGLEGGCLFMSTGLIRRGDEIYQYYSGSRPSHGQYMSCDELRLETFAAKHTSGKNRHEPALVYKAVDKSNGACAVFTGDTHHHPRIAEFAKGVPLLIHDGAHTSAKNAAGIARQAGVGRLVLIRYSQKGGARILADTKAVFPNTELAQEGSTLEVPAAR